MYKLEDSVQFLKGIGQKKYKLFNKLNIFTIEDLLNFYPKRYEDRTKISLIKDAKLDEKMSFKLRVIDLLRDYKKGKMRIISYICEDSSGEMSISFFNNRFVKKDIKIGNTYIFYGKVSVFNRNFQLSSPEYEDISKIKNSNRIRPIYSLTKGLNNNDIENAISQVLDGNYFEENLPQFILEKYHFIDKNTAIKNIHRPVDKNNFIKSMQRLKFEELFYFQLGILKNKKINQEEKGIVFNIDEKVYEFIENLPFKLTEGQKNVVDEIIEDMKKGKSINRLIQGDVGSGKTIVSIILVYIAYLNGYQAAIMAPTEILATQLFENFRNFLEPLGVRVDLLIGSTSKKLKDEILLNTKMNMVNVLVGTHSLIEDDVKFYNLGINVIDEQHRFGVVQRNRLHNKNKNAANIIMSATPIPRTLSLILYADLDVSIINSMPVGRIPVKTTSINKSLLKRSLEFIESELKKGNQAYVICALIEENEDYENLDSVEEVYEDLKNYYKDYEVGLLHGSLSNTEKNEVMEKFKNNEINIIVSTTVIEVGVNVENATVILIYNAERFGLAQLHQLRGRVGRSDKESYCILYNKSNSEISKERMKVMVESTDGFYIANRDLELRGFGDIFGTRQSGIPNLRLADPLKDKVMLSYATKDIKKILEEDGKLIGKYYFLNKELKRLYNI